ncbi:MAG: glucose-1-phosphate thymidylyltransferase RfbA [Anaerolineae bacterium]|jgi:glucose-1-phosphate thymidylyltransferase|nr:glucose-1-phosphate thymidylyltransferase RfbA [Anaerolineae bacterium]
MKGIILAGGYGSRLYPITLGTSKQLLPVYDKPMIYYPLSMLMFAGIREILLISTPEDLPNYRRLFGEGKDLGLSFQYLEQPNPGGLAEAFIYGKEFIQNSPVCLILGDNIFFGTGLPDKLNRAARIADGAVIFAYPVRDPERYGVVEFDENYCVVSLEEKPKKPRSNYAVPGIYFYDNQVCEVAKSITRSHRGELEITDLNNEYRKMGKLHVEVLGRGVAWLDAGTPESLLQASSFVQAVEERQGLMIACVEEIAYRMGFIDKIQLRKLANKISGNHYGAYLKEVINENEQR